MRRRHRPPGGTQPSGWFPGRDVEHFTDFVAVCKSFSPEVTSQSFFPSSASCRSPYLGVTGLPARGRAPERSASLGRASRGVPASLGLCSPTCCGAQSRIMPPFGSWLQVLGSSCLGARRICVVRGPYCVQGPLCLLFAEF